MIKKTTAPGASDAAEKAVPVNVLADPVVVKAEEPAKPKRSRKTKAEAEGAAKPAAKRGRKPAAKTTAEKKTSTRRSTAKKAEGPKKPTALIIMDGFGHRAEKKGNAIEAANKPNLDRIFSENPLTYIGASGHGRRSAGRPDGQLRGRSHQHRRRPHRISGADPHHQGDSGRRFLRESGSDETPSTSASGSILPCTSSASCPTAAFTPTSTICSRCSSSRSRNGLRKVCFHCFMDGRDTPPQSGIEYIDRLQAKIDAVERRLHRDRIRPLLRNGPRQPLGPRREGIQGDRARRGRARRFRA